MGSNNLKIREVVLATYSRVVDSTYLVQQTKCTERTIIEFDANAKIICVIDEQSNVAINIQNGKYFPIIQRNELGKIKYSELEKINSGAVVALRVSDKNLQYTNPLFGFVINNKARKTYATYLEEKLGKNKQQSLTLTKKKSK
ncbi:MAG: hypothetical protein E7165_00025 [Firmicutes bacterium]|nr:hypothetical protein [Bacillota bacterium]